ncbi:MAG: S41 family peptidase [Bacteroidota bacterium]
MKPHLSLTLLAIMLSAYTSAQVKFNGDFEAINQKTRHPEGWDNHMSNSTAYSMDSTVVKKGKYALRIAHVSGLNGYFAISYVIPQIFNGKTLQLKGYIKTENVIGTAGLYAGVDGTGAFDDMKSQKIAGTTDWKEYTINIPYDAARADQINIGAKLEGLGKAWFDDVRLYIDGKPIENATITSAGLKALQDKEFNYRSGVDVVVNEEQTVKKLALLAQAWGFIKYHHPAVAQGQFNMDGELFRVMPAVLKATDIKQANNAIEKWVDKFGVPEACNNCKPKPAGKVVLEPDYGDLFNEKVASASLSKKLKYILDNSNITTSFYLSQARNVGNPIFMHELEYPQTAYTDAGFRLLTLFRYWNMVQYFFPYRDIIGRDWNGVLREFIPKYILATDPNDYALISLEMITNLNDTHANVWNSLNGIHRFRGTLASPVRAQFIEDKLVVTGFYNDTLNVKNNLKIGDIINAINNSPVDHLIKLHLPYTAASNYDTKLRDLGNILMRSNEAISTLQITRDVKPLTVQQANMPRLKVNYYGPDAAKAAQPAFKLINNQVGYLYPGAYHNKDLPAIKAMFDNTKAIIVDMRCYPSEFMPFTFVPYIKPKKSDFVKFTIGSISKPGSFEMSQPIANPGDGQYKGKVIVIVNATSQSQAEYTTMAFQSSPNVTVIGSTTAGADGNVSYITLPGGISTMISGIGIFYPDGTPTQRTGVKIDRVIKPTIAGVKAGRDELLEKAIELASK